MKKVDAEVGAGLMRPDYIYKPVRLRRKSSTRRRRPKAKPRRASRTNAQVVYCCRFSRV